jgi:hypothetical protein
MFTWICPQCGREVPPSSDECPDCAKKTAQPTPPEPPAYTPPPPPPPQAPPPQAYQQPPQYAPAPQAPLPYYPPPQAPTTGPRRSKLPTWAMTVLFGVGFVALVAVIYSLVGSRGTGSSAAPSTTVENPAAKAGAKTNPLQKFIEVAGVRFVEDPKNKNKTMTKFLLINHSDADISGLAGNVTLWARTQKSEEEAAGTFAFTTNLAPGQAKEMSEPLTSKLKIYELPDWQFLTADVQITAPAQ